VDAWCGLDCGDGICHQEGAGPSRRLRCLCPPGSRGEGCLERTDVQVPRLSGLGHLALPTLQNAYSDLHLAFDFLPHSWSGLLLLTGETDDMTGDYLALLLRDGYVELRLDCGTGPGVVVSSTQVHLNQWNHLSVYRHDWGVWLQLNGGKQEEGRSKGLFSRITFSQPVYLGGKGSIRNVKHFLQMDQGVEACLRNLEINDRVYVLKPSWQGGDLVGGLDIESCNSSGCSSSGGCGSGNCRDDQCDCPLPLTGKYCEQAELIQVPQFSGSSFLRHAGLGDSALIWLQVEIVFRPQAADGLLLYNGNRNDGTGDWLALLLRDGHVEFSFDLGSGPTTVRSSSRVALGSWHNVTVTRTGREVFLSVGADQEVRGEAMSGFSQLSLSQHLWIGGVTDRSLLSSLFTPVQAFKGCIQKVSSNGLALDLVSSAESGNNIAPCNHPCQDSPCSHHGSCLPLMDSFSCSCPQGWAGPHCQERLSATDSTSPSPSPAFSATSYLFFSQPEIQQNLVGSSNSINLRVRVTASHGLLLWAGSVTKDYIMIGVKNGLVEFSFNLGSGEATLVYNSTRVDDGLWHRIRATRLDQTASLMVDTGPVITGTSPGNLRHLNPGSGLYLGGAEKLAKLSASRFKTGFTGCVAELSIGNMVNIAMLHSAERGANIDECPRGGF